MVMTPMLSLLILVLLVAGGLGFVGLLMQRRPPVEGANPDDVRRLAETVESLREEVQRLGGQINALDERMDFTERLLSAPRDRDPGSG